MREFRSPLLAPLPQKKINIKNRVKRIARRMKVVGYVTAITLIVILLITFQPLPKRSPAYLLYWLHDYIYLPVKGYTYTLYYPSSIIWWGFMATLFILWLVSFLLDRSLIRQPHLRLLRLAVHQPYLRSTLVTTARWLKHRSFEPRLLKAVVEYERILALERLAARPLRQASDVECNVVVHLTKLLIELMLLPPSTMSGFKETLREAMQKRLPQHSFLKKMDPLWSRLERWFTTIPEKPDHLSAIVYWHQAFLQMQLHDNKQAASDLVDSILYFIPLYLNYQDGNQLKDALRRPADFDPSSMMVDLLYLAYFTDQNKVEQALGPDIAVKLDKERNEWKGKLAEAVSTRRLLLDGARSQLEPQLPHRTSLTKLTLWDTALTKPTEENNWQAIGQLSIGIALNVALLADSPEIALGYIDSIEALALALQFVGSNPSHITLDLASNLSALIHDLPRPEHYRLCAKLAEAKLDKREKEWKQSHSTKDDPIKAADFALARTRVASLYHAAGPNNNQETAPIYRR